MLVAPVGAGKTLGVGGWLRHTDSPHAADAIWIHADNAWSPDRLETLLDSAASSTPASSPESRVARLVVIDDAHCLPTASVRMLDHRLTVAPETMRVLLLTRWDLPLTRLIPDWLGDLTILRGELLRLSDAECAALITEHARTKDPEMIRAVTRHAQGWCAVAVMTARALSATPDPMAAARRLDAGSGTIADQVASEVLAALTSRQRHLLLCVAGEGVVSAGDAVHLSHDTQAAQLLAELEATGLLVNRVPPEPGHEAATDVRYRVHPLLGEVVRRRLVAGGVDVANARATVARAVRLDLVQGDSAGALRRLVRMHADDEAADIVATYGVRLVLGRRGAPDLMAFVRARPDVVASRPDTWFAIALDRWVSDDRELARHWTGRILEHGTDGEAVAHADEIRACIRLWRARLGTEPLQAAIEYAKDVEAAADAGDLHDDAGSQVLAILAFELAVAQNWVGDLVDPQTRLSAAVGLAQSEGLTTLAAAAMSHLALTMFMAGHEDTAVEVATEALSVVDPDDERLRPFATSGAALAAMLGRMVAAPGAAQPLDLLDAGVGGRIHSLDFCSRFWLRMHHSRLAFTAGSVAEAERVLTAPLEEVQLAEAYLPDHLHVALLMERALLATLSVDRHLLHVLEEELRALGAAGEAELVKALQADLGGDRRSALSAFEAAAAEATYAQPPSRAIALTCSAQLLDALGRHDDAVDRIVEATTDTEVRRNAVPFLGWCHQGTPIQTLLQRLQAMSTSSWVHELTAAAGPDVHTLLGPVTATARERDAAPPAVVRPQLSPREREVLGELARGSTYADIAAALYVSENTVKTHVSSLYGKLAVSRRSEALAVARSLQLL
jgi:LuxR family transcriptional regulator, maltose regulon positive regulatory protein